MAAHTLRLLYLCLSPTFGMHQYTADFANRAARHGHDVHVVTTANLPRDRYAPNLALHTPIANTTTGFSAEGLNKSDYRLVLSTLNQLTSDTSTPLRTGLRPPTSVLVHITAPHLWNPLLIRALKKQGIPVIHTLHDLDPHYGSHFGFLIPFWNKLILNRADQIVVHGRTYQQRLLRAGRPAGQITNIPLLHLFLGDTRLTSTDDFAAEVSYEPWGFFFGRIERYKGIEHLLTAGAMLNGNRQNAPQIVVAGNGDISQCWQGNLPRQIELRNRIIDDAEAIDLFRRCGCLVLPYVDATQSALIAAAYYFRKPVVVTRSGALPEYVRQGRTGYIVEPEHPASLARCLQNLLANPALQQQLGEAGRQWYEQQRLAEEQALLDMYRQAQRRR